MGYTISGVKVKGVTIRGRKTLFNFAPELWIDYRSNVVLDTSTRVNTIRSIDQNQFFFNHNGGANGRPFISSDGISPNNASAAGGFNLTPSTIMKFLHDSSEYLFFFIGSLSGNESQTGRPLITNSGSTVPGWAVNFNAANRTYNVNVARTGGSYYSVTSSNNVIPASGVFFFAVKFYGGITGTNLKVYVDGTEYQHSITSSTFSTTDPTLFQICKQGGNTTNPLYNTKFIFVKNCLGLSDPQIDQLFTDIIAAIKTDTEYSAITTP